MTRLFGRVCVSQMLKKILKNADLRWEINSQKIERKKFINQKSNDGIYSQFFSLGFLPHLRTNIFKASFNIFFISVSEFFYPITFVRPQRNDCIHSRICLTVSVSLSLFMSFLFRILFFCLCLSNLNNRFFLQRLYLSV